MLFSWCGILLASEAVKMFEHCIRLLIVYSGLLEDQACPTPTHFPHLGEKKADAWADHVTIGTMKSHTPLTNLERLKKELGKDLGQLKVSVPDSCAIVVT